VSRHTALYLTAAHCALLLVIGLTILITGVLTDRRVGLVIEAGTATTAIGVIATAVTGYRALKAIVQHDAKYCAPTSVVELDATRRQRERTT
jgi:hypothetical protein